MASVTSTGTRKSEAERLRIREHKLTIDEIIEQLLSIKTTGVKQVTYTTIPI